MNADKVRRRFLRAKKSDANPITAKTAMTGSETAIGFRKNGSPDSGGCLRSARGDISANPRLCG